MTDRCSLRQLRSVRGSSELSVLDDGMDEPLFMVPLVLLGVVVVLLLVVLLLVLPGVVVVL